MSRRPARKSNEEEYDESDSFEDEGFPLPSPPPEQASFTSPSSNDSALSPPNWLPPPPDMPYADVFDKKSQRSQPSSMRNKPDAPIKRSSIVQKLHSGESKGDTLSGRFVRGISLSDSTSSRKNSDAASLISTDTVIEMFQEELKASLAQKKGQKVWKKITCPLHHISDCLYISPKSTGEEVQHWLEIKGFSERAREIFATMSTEAMFNLRKSQLEKHLGNEGAKLYSNILIQKNMCGYKTCTSQELKHILEERRQRVESM